MSKTPKFAEVVKIVAKVYEKDVRENTVVMNPELLETEHFASCAEVEEIAYEWLDVNRHTVVLTDLSDDKSRQLFEEDVSNFTVKWLINPFYFEEMSHGMYL